jgi:hypothetical protein
MNLVHPIIFLHVVWEKKIGLKKYGSDFLGHANYNLDEVSVLNNVKLSLNL